MSESQTLEPAKIAKDLRLNKNASINHMFIHAASQGRLEFVKQLHAAGANIDARNNLALKWACEGNHVDVVKYLLENGADVFCDNFILSNARFFGHTELVTVLEEWIVKGRGY